MRQVLDTVYPIGILVEFSNEVDPNDVMLGQVWELYGAGKTTVCQDGATFSALGGSVGTENVSLSTGNLPSHSHGLSSGQVGSAGAHTHTRGTMNITGKFDNVCGGNNPVFEGAMKYGSWNSKGPSASGGWAHLVSEFDAAEGWTGNTSENGSHTHSLSGSTNNAGSGSAHNNIQPSIIVKRWRRTA